MNTLAGEEDGSVARQRGGRVELRELGADAFGGPVGGHRALAVDRLVHQGVQRMPGERGGGAHRLLEGVGQLGAVKAFDEGVLQEVVQLVAPAPASQHDAEGLEPLGRERVPGAVGAVLGQVRGDGAGTGHVLRVAGVVGGHLPLDPRISGPVDLVGVRVERRQAAGDEDGFEPFRGGRQVVDGAESAE